jgi:hypothetical protein
MKKNLYNRTIIFSSFFNVFFTSTETNIVGQGSTGKYEIRHCWSRIYRWKYEIRYCWSGLQVENMKLDIVGQGSTGNMKLRYCRSGSTGGNMKLD